MPDPFERLVQELGRLPGLGRRSAERMALALVGRGPSAITPLAEALVAARDGVTACTRCGAVTPRGADPCRLCTDPARDGAQLLVVEEPGDILSVERSGAYRGRYHALRGLLSPQRGTVPADLTLDALRARLRTGEVRETILALPTDVEGDAMASYLGEMIMKSFPEVRVTRLAFGLPADSGVRYSDPLTLRRAIAGRMGIGAP